MNRRLVWNFEFIDRALPKSVYPVMDREALKWEARFFWPEEQIITLNVLEKGFLNLENYQQKSKKDAYFLIPAYNFNIKVRRDELLYKPLVQVSRLKAVCGFAPKQSLQQLEASEHASVSDLEKIAQLTQAAGIKIPVIKQSFTYKMATEPRVKIELSRIQVQGQCYSSLCIEGRALPLVEQISQDLLGPQASSNYTSFLKSLLKP